CFIIPGDSQGGAFLDLARTVTRRAERAILDLADMEPVHESDRLYVNRLSDLCFVLMRLEENR
ncbi:MAG: ATP:cob(I)alamin adenosyltransferase, partial [Anaerovibrio sp.]|nr:ATP:cob(I)alamin adenosyltransferase [Anaerovibrio sp.]